MALQYLCGFEMNSTSEAQIVGNTTLSIVAGRNSGLAGRALSASGTGAYFGLMRRAAGGTLATIFQSIRLYVKIGALPSGGDCTLFHITDAAGSLIVQALLATDGSVTVKNSGNVTLVSAGAGTFSADGNFHRIDFDRGYNAGAGCRMYLGGTLLGSADSEAVTAGAQLYLGAFSRGVGFTASDFTFDDVVAYDSALPATLNDYSLGMLLPAGDNAVGNWKRNDNLTTTNEFQSVDNTPPTGTAVTAVLAANYIQNGTAGSGVAADRIDLGTQAFTNLTGLTAASQVKGVMAICNGAQQVTTGSPKSGSLTTYSNPANAGTLTFDYGLPNGTAGSTTAAAQGAFPAGWGTAVGAVLENPTVTVSSGAGVRVARTGTYTRVISLDFVGVYVMWEAVAAAVITPARQQGAQFAVTRSYVY